MPTHAGDPAVLVLAIPRGGVVVGAEVARQLQAPLDIWLAHKIGAPWNPELAIGSVSVSGELILDDRTIAAYGIPSHYVKQEAQRQKQLLKERMQFYRGHSEAVEVTGKTVVLVDDGIATGSTALAALASLRQAGAAKRILAAPVAPLDVMPLMEEASDALLVLYPAADFAAVGEFYTRFEQVTDEEAIKLLREQPARVLSIQHPE
jgi:predicted phosphoribosyltransferase